MAAEDEDGGNQNVGHVELDCKQGVSFFLDSPWGMQLPTAKTYLKKNRAV